MKTILKRDFWIKSSLTAFGILFLITFCAIELHFVIDCIHAFFCGSDWEFISSLGNHQMHYGLDGVKNVLEKWAILTIYCWPCILAPLIYQIGFLIRLADRISEYKKQCNYEKGQV